MNQPQKNITVYTTEPSRIIFDKDTIKTLYNKVNLSVDRKNEKLQIVARTDSLIKTFEIEPRNSFMYWSNIVCNYGIGMLVDRNNPKRYSYPQRIYINSSDTTSNYYLFGQSNNKGELHLHISLPHINSFRLTPDNEGAKINTGFWGLTVGLDYYHSKNQFINLGVSGVSDFFVPVPAAVDISGEYELMSSVYLGLSNNHRYRRLTIGYGLSFSRNTWDLRYYDRFDPPPPTRDPVKKSHISFGLVVPSYFQIGEYFNFGVIYRPSFYRPTVKENFKYEHLVSIDFAWKIRIKK
jgi:hypothetical protein